MSALPRTAVPAVLLIDVENVIGANAQPATATARMDAMLRHTGPLDQTIAACARGRIRPGVASGLQQRGVRLLLVDAGKNAADRLLLVQAHAAAAAGTRRFVIASADAAFAALAPLGRVEILVWEGQPVAKTLSKAGAVRRLPRIRHLSVPGPSEPALRLGADTAPAPHAAAADTAAASAAPSQQPVRIPAVRWATATAAALFCGGFAFGLA
ncbi:hypothetical protein [Streptomyces monomycini]|uniref:hypothetical protein n=1 Tax=Streptomyces monomycini TaxID=371720 RepID=UPI0004AA4992|nr:hypothetical protein [Streptomyces monomycini]